jgi:hypothetical protein
MQDATILVSLLSLFYVGYSSSALLCVILRSHFISPTDLLHPSPTQHFKTSHVFFIYFLKFTLIFIWCVLLRYLSNNFQQYGTDQYGTDQSKTLTQSV